MRLIAIMAAPFVLIGCDANQMRQSKATSSPTPSAGLVDITCESTVTEVTTGVSPGTKTSSETQIYQIDDRRNTLARIFPPKREAVDICKGASSGDKCEVEVTSAKVTWSTIQNAIAEGSGISSWWHFTIDRQAGSISGTSQHSVSHNYRDLERLRVNTSGKCRLATKEDFSAKF